MAQGSTYFVIQREYYPRITFVKLDNMSSVYENMMHLSKKKFSEIAPKRLVRHTLDLWEES